MQQRLENNWSSGMSINEYVGVANSYKASASIETRNGGMFHLMSKKNKVQVQERIFTYWNGYAIDFTGKIYSLSGGLSYVGQLSEAGVATSGVMNLQSFKGYVYIFCTGTIARILEADLLTGTFNTVKNSFMPYEFKVTTTVLRITSTIKTNPIPYIGAEGFISGSFEVYDVNNGDVTAQVTPELYDGQYFLRATGSSNNMITGPYRIEFRVAATPVNVNRIPVHSYYDSVLIFGVRNYVLCIEDKGNDSIQLGMFLNQSQEIVDITSSGGYVKIYGTQNSRDTKIFYWRGAVRNNNAPANPEQIIPLDGFLVKNVASVGTQDRVMATGSDLVGHLFLFEGGTAQKIRSGRYLRHKPNTDYFFRYNQIGTQLATYNNTVYVPCRDGIFSYGTTNKDVLPSLQRDLDLSADNILAIYGIYQYGGVVYISIKDTANNFYVISYSQIYEYDTYETTGRLASRIYKGNGVAYLKRINLIRLSYEFLRTPDGSTWAGGTGNIKVYLRKDRNTDRQLCKTITDTDFQATQACYTEISPNEIPFKTFYQIEYKIELTTSTPAKTPYVYEFIMEYDNANK